MAKCQCGVDLPGRRRKCDDCKKRPGKVAPPDPPAPVYPDGLRDRGRQLWDGIGQHLDTPAGQLALEACRLADRLDNLHQAASSRGLVELAIEDIDHRQISLKVEVSGLLTETRLQQGTFKEILKQLAELKVKSAKAPIPAGQPAAPGAPAAPAPASTPLDELTSRRRQREQEA